jgi:predicted SprT family Zn-dependent metalloprotease
VRDRSQRPTQDQEHGAPERALSEPTLHRLPQRLEAFAGEGLAAPLDDLGALRVHYASLVDDKFEGVIPRDFTIRLNPFLRRLTGRITYAQRLIEISRFHLLRYGLDDAKATLEHELLHLYLHELGLPSGHNNLFKRLATEKGIRVFHANPYPKNRATPWRYQYECPECMRMVFRMRPVGQRLACGVCCRELAEGRWDARFRLRLIRRVRMV